MSGDVQPRKRKDKKKKRDGGERKSEGELTFSRQSSSVHGDESSHGVHITKMGADDVHLHVQHDHGTGGHWCAKIIFFFLMTILVGLVGLIIMENRDSTDVDTPLSESRFSTYFDGWVDEHRQDDHAHDDDDDKDMLHHDADEHDLDEDHDGDDHDDQEHEDHDEHEDDGDDKDEHQEEDEDEDQDEDEENGEDDPERIPITEDEDDEEAIRINLKADDDNEDEEDGDENNDDTVDNMDEDQDNDDDNNDDNDEDDNEDEDVNDDEDDDDEDFDDENDDDQIVDNDAGELELLQEKARQQAAAQAAKYKSLSEEKENGDNDDDEEGDDVPSWANSLLIKIGIGFALAIVARVVLIKKNTNSSKVTEHADVLLQRRLTIVTDIPAEVPLNETHEIATNVTTTLNENDYSNEEVEEEIVEEIEYIDEQDVEWAGMEAQVDAAESYKPETFEELSAMYRPKIDNNSNKTRVIEDSRTQGKTEEIIEKQENIQQSSNYSISSQESQLHQTKQDKVEGMETKSEKQSNFNDNEKIFTKSENLTSAPLKSNKNGEDSSSIIQNEMEYDEDDIYEDDDDDDDDDDAEIEDNDSEALVDEDEGGDSEEEEDEGEEDADEEEDEIEGDISDIDDTELMNRLEAKYGKLPAKNDSYSEEEDNANAVDTWTQIKPKKNGGPKTISSDEYDTDYDIFEKELRQANEEMMRKSYNQAVQTLKKLKEKYPKRSEIYLSLARALDAYADQRKSNELLMSAIHTYQQYLQYQPKKSQLLEYKETGKRCLERMTFLGQYQQAVPLHKQLIQQFPQDVDFHNQLVITYILMDRISDAKLLLKEILQKWPTDGVAAVHYGFILKQYDKDLEQAAIYLESGIASRAEGTQDGRFYFHLGDALHRLGKPERAYQIYKDAVTLKLFPSVYQRSLYNERNLRAQPFWSKTETGYRQWFEKLEKNWLAIRAEGLNALSKLGYYQNETENLRNKGEWQQFELYSRGQQRIKNCLKAPITCSMIAEFPAARDCRRGQVKFSVMQSGTHVWPHCGPTNCRLRAHLGLVVPPNTVVRVAEEENTWQEGKFLIFDDSFEHEVWHNGSSLRLVLIIDVWHPDLTAQQRRSLSPL